MSKNSERDGLQTWSVSVPLFPTHFVNLAGDRYQWLLPVCIKILQELSFTFTSHSHDDDWWARTCLSSARPLSEVRLVKCGAIDAEVDELLGSYEGGARPTISLKVEAIDELARSLACDVAPLCSLVLRHECGHHFAPLSDFERPKYMSDAAVMGRAEAAAQFFAWCTSDPSERFLLGRVAASQSGFYRSFQSLLALAEVRGTSAVWNLCSSEEGILLQPLPTPWSGEELAALCLELDQFRRGIAWLSLRDCSKALNAPRATPSGSVWVTEVGVDGLDVYEMQEALIDRGLNLGFERSEFSGGADAGTFAVVFCSSKRGETMVFRRLRTVSDIDLLARVVEVHKAR